MHMRLQVRLYQPNGDLITGLTATNPRGNTPNANQGPDKAVDGKDNTKW